MLTINVTTSVDLKRIDSGPYVDLTKAQEQKSTKTFEI